LLASPEGGVQFPPGLVRLTSHYGVRRSRARLWCKLSQARCFRCEMTRPRLRPSTGADGWAAKGGQHAGRPGAFGRGNFFHVLDFPNVLHRSYSHRYPQALRDYSHPHAAHITAGFRWSDTVESSDLTTPMVGWDEACNDPGPSPQKKAKFPKKLTIVRRFSRHDFGSKMVLVSWANMFHVKPKPRPATGIGAGRIVLQGLGLLRPTHVRASTNPHSYPQLYPPLYPLWEGRN